MEGTDDRFSAVRDTRVDYETRLSEPRTKMASLETADCGKWHERAVLRNGVYFRGVRYNSHQLMELRRKRPSLRVAVRLEKPDASAILVYAPRRKSILSVSAVSPLALRPSKENSQ